MTAAGERLDRAPAARAPVRHPRSIPRRARAAVLLLALLPAFPALADGHDERPAPAPREQEARPTGPYLGPRHRWAEEPVHRRVLHDLVAIPGSVPGWSREDHAELAGWAVVVGSLMLPAGDPLDARIDRWLAREVTPHAPDVWNPAFQAVLWGGMAIGGGGAWAWATVTRRWELAQGLSLTAEAIAVANAYHLALKLLIGRDPPGTGDGRGRIGGPPNAIDSWPAGTPSGHAATLFSATSAAVAYLRPGIPLQVAAHATAGALIVAHVVQRRHFLSESIWGAAMGWHVGRWVVAHRASPPGAAPARARVRFAPVPLRGGGAGVVVRVEH